jgi:hypothetical protein
MSDADRNAAARSSASSCAPAQSGRPAPPGGPASDARLDRRRFLGGAGLGLLAFTVGGATLLLTPREARARDVPFRVLTPEDVRVVESLGETLLPGAATAGLAHYLDQQLAATPADSLLMIRYLDVPPPYAAFYKPCLASVDAASRKLHGKPFHDLDAPARDAFVAAIQKSVPEGWQGPPAPFFYFVFRADAVDVVYGTPEGFEKLGMPYMAHIAPPTPW